MTSRLSTVAVDLAERLSHQPPRRLRRVAAAATGLAVERTQLADPRLDAALAAVRDDVPAAVAELSQVLALTEELDEIAWNAQEQAEAGVLPEQAYLAAFARARAAASPGNPRCIAAPGVPSDPCMHLSMHTGQASRKGDQDCS